MAKLTVKDWLDLFKSNVVKIRYENRNGEQSDRRVTLIESKITYIPSANPNKKVIPLNDTTVVVWDLDKNMWRRLKIDNIMFVRGLEPDEQNEPNQ